MGLRADLEVSCLGEKPLSLDDLETDEVYWVRYIHISSWLGPLEGWFLTKLLRKKGDLVQLKSWNGTGSDKFWAEFEEIMVFKATEIDMQILVERLSVRYRW